MTILTRPSLMLKKAALLASTNCDEEVIEIQSPSSNDHVRKRPFMGLVCMLMAAMFVTVAGIMAGLVLYRQVLRSGTTMHRYQGYCTIPIGNKQMDPALIEPNYRVMPLRWSSDPEVQVVSLLDEDTTDDLLSMLREELDIGDSVEKISVFENGKKVSFVHDFDANITGIIDEDRCYMMELDPSLVMAPELFVLSITRGSEFDVSRVRSSLRASLPALAPLAELAALVDDCADKPIYRLQREDPPAIRKRSADAPPHDYIQFSGRHVQEIEISNLAQILEEEQRAKNKSALAA